MTDFSNNLPPAIGVNHPDGEKSYRIIWDGHTYMCHKVGGRWIAIDECGDECANHKTLKEIKQAIVSLGNNDEDDDGESVTKAKDGWARVYGAFPCIHPCAFLAVEPGVSEDPEKMRTLGSYGYITESGGPDIEAASREMQRFFKYKQSGGQLDPEKAAAYNDEVAKSPNKGGF